MYIIIENRKENCYNIEYLHNILLDGKNINKHIKLCIFQYSINLLGLILALILSDFFSTKS